MANVRHTNGGIEKGLQEATNRDTEQTAVTAGSVQDSETDPSNQVALRKWQVGDLIKVWDDYRAIVIGVNERQSWWLSENGDVVMGFITHENPNVVFSHNTSLTYKYESLEQIQRDFDNGFFNPYFQIL